MYVEVFFLRTNDYLDEKQVNFHSFPCKMTWHTYGFQNVGISRNASEMLKYCLVPTLMSSAMNITDVNNIGIFMIIWCLKVPQEKNNLRSCHYYLSIYFEEIRWWKEILCYIKTNDSRKIKKMWIQTMTKYYKIAQYLTTQRKIWKVQYIKYIYILVWKYLMEI